MTDLHHRWLFSASNWTAVGFVQRIITLCKACRIGIKYPNPWLCQRRNTLIPKGDARSSCSHSFLVWGLWFVYEIKGLLHNECFNMSIRSSLKEKKKPYILFLHTYKIPTVVNTMPKCVWWLNQYETIRMTFYHSFLSAKLLSYKYEVLLW